MKFLVDVGVGMRVQSWLQSQKYDSKAVRTLDPRMSDRDIIQLAADEQRMVITMDKDFGELVYHSGMTHCGILLLRLEDANSAEKIAVLESILNNYAEQIENHFCVYQNDRLRIRKARSS